MTLWHMPLTARTPDDGERRLHLAQSQRGVHAHDAIAKPFQLLILRRSAARLLR
jgi:hypothetical protein